MKKHKKPVSKKQDAKGAAPFLKWQVGEYSQRAELKMIYPQSFLLLCRLVEITPGEMICDFIDNLSCSNWNRDGRDSAKSKLIDYFIEHGYGQHIYSAPDLRTILREMDALGNVWPADANMKLIELSQKWRNKYQKYWFKKWFQKPRRKI